MSTPLSNSNNTERAAYQFIAPCTVLLMKSDGQAIKMGYGIGDRVELILPKVPILMSMSMSQSAIDASQPKECPLADGTGVLIDLFDNARSLKRVALFEPVPKADEVTSRPKPR